MIRKKQSLLLAILFSLLLMGCNADKQKKDIYDDKNITIDFLIEKQCLFYDNLVFASDKKNHVFVVCEDKIINHYKYNKAVFNEENFNIVRNKNMIEAVEYIGIPSYAGKSDDLSLDYSYNDGYIRRLKMFKNNNEMIINNVEILDKENPETWFDEAKTKLPSLKQFQEIIVVMSIDEVVKKIGKPQRDIGCGARLFQFDLENGEKRTIRFDLDVEKEDEFVYKNPNVTLYGSHFLYVGMICEDLDK